ncbi:hypothetical protein AALG83_02080 [Christensenellaceae bacterium 44-20]
MKRYPYLKERLSQLDIQRRDLGKHLERSDGYITSRMQGKGDWTITEMYKIMELIGEPEEYLHLVFPKNRKTAKSYEEVLARKARAGSGMLPQNMCVVLMPADELRQAQSQQGLRLVR